MARKVPYSDKLDAALSDRLRRSAEVAYFTPVRKDPDDETVAHATGKGRRQDLYGPDGTVVTVDHRNGRVIHVQPPEGAGDANR